MTDDSYATKPLPAITVDKAWAKAEVAGLKIQLVR